MVDLAGLGSNPARAAARRGLVVVQRTAAVAATQPIGALQQMHAVTLSARVPIAFLSGAALWVYGRGPEPEQIEVGVNEHRGLSVSRPVVARRVSATTLTGVVQRNSLPLVALETAMVQRAAQITSTEALTLVTRALRDRVTTVDRLRAACRRGFAGSRAVRAALVEVRGGDLELQTRRLRRALLAAGVTGLRTEAHLTSSEGVACYLDLLHEASARALELDGPYHDLPEQRRIDRRRDRWVRAEFGIEVIRIADEEVRRDLAGVVAELVPQLRPVA